MSGDERNSKDIAAGDEKISHTEASSFGESLSSAETAAEEELMLPGASVGGFSTEEQSLAGAVGGCSTEEQSLAGAVGGCEEASSETVPKVTIGVEELQRVLLRHVKYQISQFQGIKDDLLETIGEMKKLSRRNPGNWESFERLREYIRQANAFLAEINEAIMVRESRGQYMSLQIRQFFERLREQEHFTGTTFSFGTIGGASVDVQTASRSSNEQNGDVQSDEASIDRNLSAFIEQIMYAAGFGSGMGEMNESKEVQASIGMEAAGGAAGGPDRMEVEREDEDRDQEGRLLNPPVIGKYTLAITAHQRYPESSSSDSPERDLPMDADGPPRQMQQAEDPSRDNCSSDSSNDAHRDPYGL